MGDGALGWQWHPGVRIVTRSEVRVWRGGEGWRTEGGIGDVGPPAVTWKRLRCCRGDGVRARVSCNRKLSGVVAPPDRCVVEHAKMGPPAALPTPTVPLAAAPPGRAGGPSPARVSALDCALNPGRVPALALLAGDSCGEGPGSSMKGKCRQLSTCVAHGRPRGSSHQHQRMSVTTRGGHDGSRGGRSDPLRTPAG